MEAGNRRVHILIVEHDTERLRDLEATLSRAGHQTEVVSSASLALAALARPAAPDLLLVGEELPDMPALDFLQAASVVGALPPVVVLGASEAGARGVEATRLGAVDFVLADDEGSYLGTLAGRLVGARERAAAHDRTARMADALASTSAAVLIADRTGAVEMINDACAHLLGREDTRSADCALTDLLPEDGSSRPRTELLAAVQAGSEWAGEVDVLAGDGQRVPCIVTVSPIRRPGGRMHGMVLTFRDVADRVAMEDALRAANRRLAEQAARDALTGLYNRAYLHEVLEREMARAIRYGTVLSLLMLDLDDFKRINDEHGHPVGDEVLREVGRRLRPVLRDGDVLARYGGDEFCAILPNTDEKAARLVADRLRNAVLERGVGPDASTPLGLSVGIATSVHVGADDEKPSEALLRYADRALYTSKATDGQHVTMFEPA